MLIKAKVGISNRHVHLSQEVYDKLFSHDITVKRYLSVKNEFASNETVTIKGPKGQIENVRVMGPHRGYNQVEVSKRDARLLGLNPPVRKSGCLSDALEITLLTSKAEVTLQNALIIANRHLHMSPAIALSYNLHEDDQVKVLVKGDKSCILDAYVKIKNDAPLELHLDTDDGNSCLLNNDDEVEIII